MSSNLTVWYGGVVSDPWMPYLAMPIQNNISQTIVVVPSTCFLFDVRVMDEAISENDGTAADSSNLGTISYMFDDMVKNNGQVHLPFG